MNRQPYLQTKSHRPMNSKIESQSEDLALCLVSVTLVR